MIRLELDDKDKKIEIQDFMKSPVEVLQVKPDLILGLHFLARSPGPGPSILSKWNRPLSPVKIELCIIPTYVCCNFSFVFLQNVINLIRVILSSSLASELPTECIGSIHDMNMIRFLNHSIFFPFIWRYVFTSFSLFISCREFTIEWKTLIDGPIRLKETFLMQFEHGHGIHR